MIPMIRFGKLLILCFAYLLSPGLFGQELRPLQVNPILKKHVLEHPSRKKATSADTIAGLPFFDDFSGTGIYPDPALWSDRYAFVNNTYGYEPITYGVVTLDAINDKGDVYSVGASPVSCDTLTSNPIKLAQYAGNPEGVRLSFFYQPGGLGEAPEYDDSIVLEFYRPDLHTWNLVWRAYGESVKPFTQVIIEVNELFCQDGFRFRFRNYASMSENEVKGGKGALSNVDLWHLDYIRLNTKPVSNHEKVYDLSIISNLASSFKTYQQVPWDHVDYAAIHDFRDVIPLTIRTNSRLPQSLTDSVTISRIYYVKDLKTGSYLTSPYVEGIESVGFDTIIKRSDIFIPPIAYDGGEEGIIETGATLFVEDSVENHANNTVTRIEHYRNAYAYDDGTPEFGFGISGESVSGSLITCMFEIFRSDSLRAVDILFNHTKNDFTDDKPFQLIVLGNADGQPGDILYIDSVNYTPDPSKGFLELQRIVLRHPVFIHDTVFIGIQQFTNEFLNIGYDLNDPHKDRIFYNITGVWKTLGEDIFNGSLIIRPVVANHRIALGMNKNTVSGINALLVYPNPTKEILYFRLTDTMQPGAKVRIVDLTGKYYKAETDSESVNIGMLKPGVYILQVIAGDGQLYTAKFSVTQ